MKSNIFKSFITIFFLHLSVVTCNAQNPEVKRTTAPDSSFTITYTANGKITKRVQFTKDGVRDGITEEWHYDGNQVDHIRYVYELGVLKEIIFLMPDGTLREKSVYEDGIEKYNIQISAARSKPGKPHYIKKVYNSSCGFMQFNMIGEVVVDSVLVPKGR